MAAGTVVFDIQARGSQAQNEIAKVQNSFKNLEKQAAATTGVMTRFQNVLAGLAIGNLVRSAIGYADAISDISKATGIATAAVMGFGKAVQANGGNIDAANTALYKFTTVIGDAAQGSAQAQDAFARVGVSLQDLRTLSEQDLLTKTIQGLSQIGDISTRNALAVDLLGKGIKGVDIQGLAGQFDAATQASLKYAQATAAAAELQDKLDAAVKQVYVSILQSIEPIVKYINSLDPTRVSEFIDSMVKLAGTAIGLLALSKALDMVVKSVILAGSSFAILKAASLAALGGFAGIGTAVGSITKTVGIFSSQMKYAGAALTTAFAAGGVKAALASLGTTFEIIATKRIPFLIAGLGGVVAGITAVGGALLRVIPVVGQIALVAMALNEVFKMVFDIDAIDWFMKKLSEAYNWVAKLVGLPKWEFVSSEQKKQLDEAKAKQEQIVEQEKARAEEARRVQDAHAALRKEIEAQTREFAKQITSARERVELDSQLIGVGAEQNDIIRAQSALQEQLKTKLEEIAVLQSKLTEAQLSAGIGEDYARQAEEVTKLAEAEQQRLTNAIKLQHELQAAEQLRLFGLKAQQDSEDKLLEIQREMAKSTMSAIEQKYYDISNAADDAAKAAIRAEEARRGVKLDPSEAEQYYRASRQGLEQLYQAQKNLYEGSRTFSAGWRKAFNEYADDATNAAKTAENLFRKFTQGLEDLIVNFVKTGKFEWKDFLNSMAEELLRSQLRSLIAQTMGGLGELFGLDLGGGGAMNGQGSTASNPLYVMDVSGGGGGMMGGLMGNQNQGSGGLLGQIGGALGNLFGGDNPISNTAPANWYQKTQAENFYEPWKNTSMMDTITSGIGDAFSSVGSWVGDIASSVGDFFGGWFANGGTLGAGKWGIAGENGPELISGPAQVTPMSAGGSTSVTYNINAVDARSFQQLLAQDPQLIFALTEQGRRSYAGAR